MSGEFQVQGKNGNAPFSLKLHRGDGMVLVAMNWRGATPPDDFVGFWIEYREPDGDRFFTLSNMIGFPDKNGKAIPGKKPSRESPLQVFRWVHFPRNADLEGEFTYRVTPVFMNSNDELSYGSEVQEARVELRRETHPGQLNVTFTRGFVSSQRFIELYGDNGGIAALLPPSADEGLDFVPTHPKAEEALEWMGFEARREIYRLLDDAIADPTASVLVNAYDLSEAGFVERLKKLKKRLRIIVDDSVNAKTPKPSDHGGISSGETKAAEILRKTAGAKNVRRHHIKSLEHNKFVVVTGNVNKVVAGSTNFSWRGFYVQANNAVILSGASAIEPFVDAFERYWQIESGKPDYDQRISDFAKSSSAVWNDLGLNGIDAKVAFSPHSKANALLDAIAEDIDKNTKSSLFYSLAFLHQLAGNKPGEVPGSIIKALNNISNNDGIFVYGMSDSKAGGIVVKQPDGNAEPVMPSALSKNLQSPFKEEVTGGKGIRLHHKFVVIDFDRPTARVYLGSYNFSGAADLKNGENLLLIKDRRVAVAYMVEALRLFDHYAFRIARANAKKAGGDFVLKRPPRAAGEEPWWRKNYTNPRRIRDRELFD